LICTLQTYAGPLLLGEVVAFIASTNDNDDDDGGSNNFNKNQWNRAVYLLVLFIVAFVVTAFTNTLFSYRIQVSHAMPLLYIASVYCTLYSEQYTDAIY
jgi:hypothetical protein